MTALVRKFEALKFRSETLVRLEGMPDPFNGRMEDHHHYLKSVEKKSSKCQKMQAGFYLEKFENFTGISRNRKVRNMRVCLSLILAIGGLLCWMAVVYS